jgi:hypothetical protein
MTRQYRYERQRVEGWGEVEIPHQASELEVEYPDSPEEDVAIIHYLVPVNE